MEPFKISCIPYSLSFKKPATTSRGTYVDRKIYYIKVESLTDSTHWGIGECAPLPDLSCDYDTTYLERLEGYIQTIEAKQAIDYEALRYEPSILFGLEVAFRHFLRKSLCLWDSPFSNSSQGIPINGLIWMDTIEHMTRQIETKLAQGFHCIKLKIGACDFEQELNLIKAIRARFSVEQIQLRVDANGAFASCDAEEKLKRLSDFEIHSIEQPIKAGQWEEMAQLCEKRILPIALDEELIGLFSFEEKREMLTFVQPDYIILKPSLHGGLLGCQEWANLAESNSIPYWFTSALESNVGLNAIAQYAAAFSKYKMPQGLGTGQLFTTNIKMPIVLEGETIYYKEEEGVDYAAI